MSLVNVDVISGCGTLGGGLDTLANDLGVIEAGGSAFWVNGTTETINFRPGGTSGPTVFFSTDARLRNLTDAVIDANSQDAVTGRQLNATNNNVSAVDAAVDTLGAGTASSLGGGATYDPATGTLTAPSYAVGGTTVNSVGDALTNLDGRTTQNATSITALGNQVSNGTVGLVQQDATSRNLTVGAATNGAGVDFTGTDGARVLTGLGNGAITATSADAINGSQLYASNSSIATGLGGGSVVNPNGTVSAPAYQIGGTTYGSVGGALGAVNSALGSLSSGGGIKFFRSNSTLADSTASGTDSVGIGPLAVASGTNAVAIGNAATAADANSVALGNGARTAAAVATAAGTIAGTSYAYAGVSPTGTVSIGADAVPASGGDPAVPAVDRTLTHVAAGRVSATSTDAVNGSQLNATHLAVAAVDSAVDTLGAGTAASLGGGATYDPATGALGAPSYSVGGTTVNNVGGAVSNLDGRTTQNTAAIDDLADQIGSGSVGLVQQDATSRNLTVGAATDGGSVDFTGSAGVRVLTGLGNGAVSAISTDAINGSQLYASNSSIAAGLGGGSVVNPNGTVSAPAYQIGGSTYTSVGGALGGVNSALSSLSSGGGVKYFRANSTLADSTASGTNSLAAGPLAAAEGASATAIGHGASALSSDSLALGRGAVAGVSGGTSGEIAVGATASATANTAIAIGSSAIAADVGAVALGAGARTAAVVATASGTIAGVSYAYAGNTPTATVSLGADAIPASGGNPAVPAVDRTVTHLAAGRVNATSTDAINGSQLNATNLAVTAVDGAVDTLGAGTASSLGGGATYDPATGTLGAPSYSVGGTTVSNVGGAVSNLDGRTTQNTAAITALGDQLGNGTVGLVQQNPTTRNLTVGAATDGTSVNFTGTGGARVLTGVAAGAVSATSTDAINGSQLRAANTSIASALGGGAVVNTDGTVSTPTYHINGTDYSSVGDALDHLVTGGVQSVYFHANSVLGDSSPQGTDSIAVGPLANAESTDAIAMGRNAAAGTPTGGAGAIAVGADASAAGVGALALGSGATAAQDGAVALGAGAVTETAIGTTGITLAGTAYTFAGGVPIGTVSIGSAGAERTLTHVAAGRISATSTDAVNGSQLHATNQSVEQLNGIVSSMSSGGGITYFRANATGPDAMASGVDSVAIGPNAVASHDGSVALGAGSQTTVGAQAGYSAAYVGASTSSGEVNVGNRTVSGVAAGAAGTDAVNVSQLTSGVQEAINSANAYTEARVSQLGSLPGGATPMLSVSSPAGRTAVAAGADSLAAGAGAQAGADNSLALGNDAQAMGERSVAIGADSVADRANTVSVGAVGAERTISNVAAGSADTDAVNVAQLKQSQASIATYDTSAAGTPDYGTMTLGGPGGATNTRVRNVAAGVGANDAVNVQQLQTGLQDTLLQSQQYTDNGLREVRGDMWTMRKEMRGGAASAMAMAGMPQSSVPGGNMLSMGVGGYQGEVGMALGLSTMTADSRYILKANVSTNTSHDFGFAVGAGIQW